MEGVLKNTLPVLVLSIILSLLLLFAKELIVRILTVFGKFILAVAVFGMVVSGLEFLLGRTIVEGMTSLEEVCTIIGQICIFIAGVFPLLAVIKRLANRPLTAASRKLGINGTSCGDFLTTLANSLPTLADLPRMDEKGRMLNVAFATSACFVFGDHLAYLAAAAPEVSAAMIAAKLTAGICGLALAIVLAPKLLK
jgi:ethanolamine transporter